MTVDLLPFPRTTEPAHRDPAAKGRHPSCVPAGPHGGWGQAERDCPYCSGPESD